MMKIKVTSRFKKSYKKLNMRDRRSIQEAMDMLSEDFSYPSLRSKKMKGYDNIFEASANMDLRITFHLEKPDTLVFRNCGHHDSTLRTP